MESRTRKVLLGCGVGCATVLLLVVGSCVAFNVWLNRPGSLLEPERLLGEDTTGYVEWTLRLEDPGTLAFIEDLLAQMQEFQDAQRSPLPPVIDRWLGEWQRRESERDMRRFFPAVVAWTLQPGEGADRDLHLFSVSCAGLGRRAVLADWALGIVFRWADELEAVRHRDERIYLLPEARGRGEPLIMFIRDGQLFFTSDVGTARTALDRLGATESPGREATALERLFESAPGDGPLRGAVSNERGELLRVLRILGLEETDGRWEALVGATLSAGFTEEAEFAGAVELHGADPRWAEAHGGSLAAALRSLLGEAPLEVVTESSVEGNRIRVDFRIEEFRIGDHVPAPRSRTARPGGRSAR